MRGSPRETDAQADLRIADLALNAVFVYPLIHLPVLGGVIPARGVGVGGFIDTRR